MSKRHGHAYEAQFIADALTRGLDVAKPEGDFLPYDLLVTNDGGKRWLRVQVKGTAHVQAGKPLPTYKVLAARGYKSKTPIESGDVDVLAAWVAPALVWYHVPIKNVKARSIYLAPTRESRNQYEIWRDAWNVYHVK